MTAARAAAWLLRIALAAIVVAIVAVALTACTLFGTSTAADPATGESTVTGDVPFEAIPVDAVALVEYRVYAPLPDLDDSTRTTDDPERIRELVDLLNERSQPGGYSSDEQGVEPCPPGSRTAYVGVTLTSGELLEFSVRSCDENAWAQQLLDLVWGWADADGR